jgi:TonB-linked SusC/RagA family outer membrane protein
MKQALLKRCSFLLFALVSLLSNAQTSTSQIKITGTVTDPTGLLVPGVNVTEKSTKNSVSTDFNGKYEINVKPGATLVFSFIGMKKVEIPLNGRTNVDAKMQEDSNVLDDIVVVAYGSQKKQKITGAIVQIDPTQVQDLPVSNLSESLRGLVPGLSVSGGSGRPGDQAFLQIRQTFSFSKDGGSTMPLIVIDDMVQVDPGTGLPSMEAFNRLDPTEVESITVLKDGSAAIYGSRASQGAIVVKTKRGKVGATKFSYLSQFSVNDAISHTKTMNAYEYGLWSNRFLSAKSDDTARLFSGSELEEMKGLNYDWLDKAWKPAIQQKHAFNVSGGTEKATYYAGASYFTQGANLGKQDYNKWTFRTGTNIKVSNSLDFSAAISANTTDIEKSFTKASANISDGSYGSLAGGGEQADYGYLLHMPKYIPWSMDYQGQEYFMSPFPRTDRNLGAPNNRTIAGWNYFATLDNGSKQMSNDFSYNVNMSVNYKVPFVKGLSVKGTYARTEYTNNSEQVQLPFDLVRIKNYEKEGFHLASAAEENNMELKTNTSNARVAYNTSFNKSVQSNFFINYDRTFGNHDIEAMAGVEKTEADYTNRTLLYENTGKDYGGTYQTAGTLSTSNSVATKGESGTLSYLGRINYSFKDRYLLQLLFRSDASTKFAPENYWGFFPSAQLGWIVSKEDWFHNALPGVDFLKLRYSIGKTGKDNVQAWRWDQYYDIITDKGYQFGSNGGLLGAGVSPKVNPNRNVGWDTTIKNNLGLDFNALRSRLQVSIDYYYDKNTDMLTTMAGTVGVPISVGGAFAEQNYARVDAWGTEFSVNWSDKATKNLSYNVGVNFGFNGNEIKKFPEQALRHPSENVRQEGASTFFPAWGFRTWKGTSTGDGILRTDEDILNYWNYLTERATAAGTTPMFNKINDISGMRKGMLAYQDIGGQFDSTTGTQAGADGRIEKTNDYVKLVDKNRTYGFTTNFGIKYKGFFARTQIATSWGGFRDIDLVKQGTSSSHNMWSHESFLTDMYGSDNVDGKYPNIAFYDDEMVGSPSDFWQLDTFRCTVRNLTLGFALPKDVLSSINIETFTIGVTGNNLWDLYNPYPDHYRNMYDSPYMPYPTLRTWSLNVNLSF